MSERRVEASTDFAGDVLPRPKLLLRLERVVRANSWPKCLLLCGARFDSRVGDRRQYVCFISVLSLSLERRCRTRLVDDADNRCSLYQRVL